MGVDAKVALALAAAAAPEEVGSEVLPKDYVDRLTTLFGHGCRQRLLRGRYGITAFELVEPKAPGPKRRVCVYSHGLGQCYGSFHDTPLVQTLAEGGYTVLAYSFYGHGWSYAGEEVLGVGGAACSGPMPEYGCAVHLAQVKELLSHVMQPGEPVDCWVGHSTGGVVGVYVAAENVWPIRTFGNVSAAFWAEKPAVAKFIESCSSIQRLMLNTECGLKLLEDAYTKNNDNAFGKVVGDDTKYLFQAKKEAAAEGILRNFAHHPQLAKGIAAISSTFLRGDQMPEHQSMLRKLLQREDGPERYCCIWGTQDIVVPFKHAQEVVSLSPQRVKLATPCLGHECIHEDARQIAQIVVDELFKGTE